MGRIFGIIGAIVAAGLILALLTVFNFNVVELFKWAWNGVWTLVKIVANFFLGNDVFNRVARDPLI